MSDRESAPTESEIAELVRGQLGVPADARVRVEAVERHSNINYVFRVRARRRSFYVKLALTQLKRFELSAPRERVLYEAAALERLGGAFGPSVRVPEVLFVDRERYAIGLSDVGRGRRVLLDVLDGAYREASGLALPLGAALGRAHRATRDARPLRSARVAERMRATFHELLAVGLRRVAPDAVTTWLDPLCDRRESLVHTDLWGKNLLFAPGRRPALLDFENADLGDPALDVGAVLCLFLIPVLRGRASRRIYRVFARDLLRSFGRRAGPGATARCCERSFAAVGIYLAHRSVGSAPYEMSSAARARVAARAARLLEKPPTELEAYLDAVLT